MTKNLPYDRAQRVADEIHRIIVSACYNEISDPRIRGLEITDVTMTKDLQIARVYYYMQNANEDDLRRAKEGLESASGFFKRAIARDINLRYTPAIEFFYDETVDLEKKIDQAVAKGDA
jgi:ribosome-binding factor A